MITLTLHTHTGIPIPLKIPIPIQLHKYSHHERCQSTLHCQLGETMFLCGGGSVPSSPSPDTGGHQTRIRLLLANIG